MSELSYDQLFDLPTSTTVGPYVLIAFTSFVVISVFIILIVRSVKQFGKPNPVHGGAFRFSAAKGDINAMELIKKQANFDVNVCHDGFTALHAACVTGKARAVSWLIKNGATVSSIKNDHWNDSALHYAAAKGHLEVVEILVNEGNADISSLNFNKQTPLDLARAQSHLDIVHYLEAALSCPTIRVLKADKDSTDEVAQVETPFVLSEETEKSLQWVLERRTDNTGMGVKQYPHTILTRYFVIATLIITLLYIVWRATRTLSPTYLKYSAFVYVSELFLTFQFLLSLVLMWNPITRDNRDIYKLGLKPAEFPSVDIFVVTYNEDESIVEATVCAACNLQYPGNKVNIFVLDDGKREHIKEMTKRISKDLERFSDTKGVSLFYIARPKVKGVDHHAKAGNINHCFLKEAASKSDFVLILDCDMIVTPRFLRETVPHFFEKNACDKFVIKEKAAMLQVPQRFWNLGKNDPWWHTAEDFNAAGFEGSDGVGGTPCVGTGVLFKRECLVSIGGQSFWSVTEDFKTSFNLLANGFSTMYLFRNLVYGIAVDDLVGIYKQRLRWSTGGLQILCSDNPLLKPGLTVLQTILFFCNAWQYVLCIPYIVVTLVPLIYFAFGYSPVTTLLMETALVLGGFILFTRLMQWWQVRLITSSKDMALWRGCQQVVWLSPIFFHSLINFLILNLVTTPMKRIFRKKKGAVAFVTSRKDGAAMPIREILKAAWFIWIVYLFFVFGIVWNIATLAAGIIPFSGDWAAQFILGFALSFYVCAMLYIPFSDCFDFLVREKKGTVEWTFEEGILGRAYEAFDDNSDDDYSDRNSSSSSAFSGFSLTASDISDSSKASIIKKHNFKLIEPIKRHYKYRIACGLMVLVAVVGLPIVATYYQKDTRIF